METALWILALIGTVTAASVIAKRVGVPAPLLLVVVGVGASFLPFVEPFELSPELVLVGLLPPLLYSASSSSSASPVCTARRWRWGSASRQPMKPTSRAPAYECAVMFSAMECPGIDTG